MPVASGRPPGPRLHGVRAMPWRAGAVGARPPRSRRSRVLLRDAAPLCSVASRTPVQRTEGAHVRVLGVDPGLTRCGLGVVDGAPGRPLTLVDVGVVRTPRDADLGAAPGRHRARQSRRGSTGTRPTPSPSSGSSPAQRPHGHGHRPGQRRSPCVAAARRGLPVALHTPSEVKAAVTGSGRADKAQVAAMVTRMLGLDGAPKPADAADALALAICHVWRGGPSAHRRGPAPPAAPSRPADDRVRARAGRRRRPRPRRCVEVGGVGCSCTCTPATPAALRAGRARRRWRPRWSSARTR